MASPDLADTARLTERLLRQAVVDHVSAERRRVFAPVLHVGEPGARVVTLPLGEEHVDQRLAASLDHALRTDVLEAMVRRLGVDGADDSPGHPRAPLAWLTRRGPLDAQDLDLAWASAARSAAAELGHPLLLVVVTRRGWRDPVTGATRTWRRLRPRRP